MNEPFHVEVKKLYWPGSFETMCPKCGDKWVVNGTELYVSYPTANVPFEFHLGCRECDEQWSVRVILHLSLEVLPDA